MTSVRDLSAMKSWYVNNAKRIQCFAKHATRINVMRRDLRPHAKPMALNTLSQTAKLISDTLGKRRSPNK